MNSNNNQARRVSIVGAGFIAPFHAQVLGGVPNIVLDSVVDTNANSAAELSRQFGIPRQYGTVEEMIADGGCDVAHVLAPPPAHAGIAIPLLDAGIDVLIEKPLATSSDDCSRLVASADGSGSLLGVNHSLLFDPTVKKLKERIQDRSSGGLHHLSIWANLPLRQLSAGQFGHWMFRAPQNIVFEQAVHPISIVLDMAGGVEELTAVPGTPRDLVEGVRFYDTWQIAMSCEDSTAQLFMSFGKGLATLAVQAICEDEVLYADLLNGRITSSRKSRWHDVPDSLQSGLVSGASTIIQSFTNTSKQAIAMLGLRGRADSFYVSMKQSIEAYHVGLDNGEIPVDGRFGAAVIAVCEQIAAGVHEEPSTMKGVPEPKTKDCDVLVIGGTGFIGRSVVQDFIDKGHTVRVMARNIDLLPALFRHENVETIRGSSYSEDDVRRALEGVKVVVDLAHGGAGNLQQIRERMIGGAENVARCCQTAGVQKLVFASTIAALYLGDESVTITGSEPPDPMAESRGIYSYGKAECEKLLNRMHREEGLPVCIVRPGVVIGAGGLPYHSGFGLFVRDKHCIGWNSGKNPLPLVLVEDVAAAIVAAAASPTAVGKTYNLVGDVRLSAREYLSLLEKTLGRSLVFHPRHPLWLQIQEIGKWMVKVVGRKADNPFPSYRDLKSRGMVAKFDCSDVVNELSWKPENDRNEVIRKGIDVYGDAP